ncbi:MAG TPA: maleylpyruvate isomerase family mycothiol-dependent enzyme, partial [Sphingobacteriaceae bacterium]
MIEVIHLFPELDQRLISLLKGLNDRQWASATVCREWTVGDIAAHLLDTCLRRLSIGRDGFRTLPPSGDPSFGNMVRFLNDLNASWVAAFKRVSPEVLTGMLETFQPEYERYLAGLDPEGPALFPVAWAGEEQSKNWFDIAREYTERFLHQQQIRHAVGAESLLTRELYFPFLDILMQALPFTYNTWLPDTPESVTVRVDIIGEAGGSWTVRKDTSGWAFASETRTPDSQVYISEQIAWLLLSKGIDVMEARQFWQVTGDQELGSGALRMISVM